MKRRNFLKSLLGASTVPFMCNAKFLKAKYVKCSINMNPDNIKTNGTFDEWIESIRAEADRLLNSNLKKGDEKYLVDTKWCTWGYEMPARAITIKNEFNKEYTYFSYAKFEFDRDQSKLRRKFLINLAKIRFEDAIASVYCRYVEYGNFLNRLNFKGEL